MVCTQCRTPNFSDYKFCRECGGRLDASGAMADGAADPDLEALLQDAFARMEAGEFGRALGSIQAALARNPESPAAHGALGLLYERQGELSEAIHQFRVVLDLCPDSTADRDKLAALIAQAGLTEREGPLTPRRFAFACAAAAGVLTFAVGWRLLDAGSARASGPEARPLAAAPAQDGPGVTPAAPTQQPPVTPWNGYAAPLPAASTAVGFGGLGGYNRPTPPRGLGAPGPAIPDSLRQARGLAPAGIVDVEPISRPVATPMPAPQPNAEGPSREAGEPIETETGFIRIEPVEKPAERPAPPPPAAPSAGPAGQPRITVTISPGR